MKPSPIITGTVCSACGLDWDRHDKKTLDTCVELLKADLAREKQRLTPQPALPIPYPVPYPVPRPNPYAPHWRGPGWVVPNYATPQITFIGNSTNQSMSARTALCQTNGGVYQ